MEFQEYPKCLYRSADAYRIAADADEEEAHRADGFMDHADLPQEAEPEPAEVQAEDAPPAISVPAVKRQRGRNKAK